MEKARAEHPSLRKVLILEQLPRTDSEHLSTLVNIYNTTLREMVTAAPPSSHCQILVASHNSLTLASKDMRSAVFGSPSARGTDGIHFRGKEGSKTHTSSIISALKSAGLNDWSTQGRRGAGRQQNGRTHSQTVGTSNQFAVLN